MNSTIFLSLYLFFVVVLVFDCISLKCLSIKHDDEKLTRLPIDNEKVFQQCLLAFE